MHVKEFVTYDGKLVEKKFAQYLSRLNIRGGSVLARPRGKKNVNFFNQNHS